MSETAGRSKGRAALLAGGLVLGGVAVLAVLAGAGIAGYAAYVLEASRPQLTGSAHIAGLTEAATVERDAAGVPKIVAGNRQDLARALGFLHGQERFFEMDLLRRAGAGELSALVGPAALKIDMARRLHRFRARATANWAAQPAAAKALVQAYTDGVNAGLASLGHAPFEYTVLRVAPAPWTAVDTALVTYAMYFDLQDSDADAQLTRQAMQAVLGPAMLDFLAPHGTPHDAPIDGSILPEPAMPAAPAADAPPAHAAPAPPEHGSNNFAVAGKLTANGAAIVANDMHLALGVPNIWYRAEMQLRAPGAAAPSLDLVGVTLPGTPFLVVGSNRHVAWAFTDGYVETGDAVVVDTLPDDPRRYRTEDGVRRIESYPEQICAAHGACQTLNVDETIWGPVVGTGENGKPIAWAWTAHDPNAVLTDGFIGLEGAQTVRDALDAAHRAGMPQQNFVVGDSAGHIAWTIIGQVPRRAGLDDQLPHSWADGSHGWHGYLTPAEIPEIVDPPGNRLWTANARAVGGDALEKLGDGGYAEGLRAGRIRDDLDARSSFSEPDLLAIQTDTRATVLDSWQRLVLAAIAAHGNDAKIAALKPYAENWGGRAVPGSVGYRIVRAFRARAIRLVYEGLMRPVAARLNRELEIPGRAAWPVERLLAERPPSLLPAGYHDWDAVTGAVLSSIVTDADQDGGLASWRWGAVNRVGIHHPLSRFVPLLGYLTDPPDLALAGDTIIPRVAVPGFGASERLVVSPGHEETAIFDMPVGQAANPLAPYFGAGQQDWVEGRAGPLLPGAARWRLALVP
jgi:penicillin amidase